MIVISLKSYQYLITYSVIRVKPISKMHNASKDFIRWFEEGSNRNKSLYLSCESKVNTDMSWSFYCVLKRLPFPSGVELTNEIEELHRRSKTISKLPIEIEVEEKKKFYYPVITFLSIPGRLSKIGYRLRLILCFPVFAVRFRRMKVKIYFSRRKR